MIGEKYIGLDVHQATISVAVMDSKGSKAATTRGDSDRAHRLAADVGASVLRTAEPTAGRAGL